LIFLGTLSLRFYTNMKLRPSTSSCLRRLEHLNSPSYNARYRSKRAICGQCRREARGVFRAPEKSENGLRSSAPSATLSSTARRPLQVLPAAFIAGQRRPLATIQNGAHGTPVAILCHFLTKCCSQSRRSRANAGVRLQSHRRTPSRR